MIDIAAITGAFDGIKGAVQILEGAVARRDQAKIDAALADIAPKLLEAYTAAFQLQAEHSALLRKVGDLEGEIMRLKDWNTDKARYELKEAGYNKVLVYAPKEFMRGTEPDHRLCATCYQNGVKSILQPETRMPGRDEFLFCRLCGSDLCTQGDRRAEHAAPARKR